MSKYNDLYGILSSFIPTAIYMWGGKGEIIPADDTQRKQLFERKETSDSSHSKAENVARCERLYQRRKNEGVAEVRGFDCSGFVYYGLHALGLLNTRYSSRTFYSHCAENTDKTGMTRNDLVPGDLVFEHDGKKIVHVALYIGNGQILESGGRDVGVQIRKLGSGDNRYGRLACMKEADPEPAPAPEPTFGFVRVKGGSVYVRDANSKSGKVMKTAHKGQKYALILIDPDTGWYKINLGDGRTGYISNRADLTEVVVNA